MSSVYDYIDYRRFLTDRFSHLKRNRPLFSYRAFHRIAGIKSSGFLSLVLTGKRNLGEEGIHRVALGLHLNDEDRRYFQTLVRFNQSKTAEGKDRYFRELTQNKKFLAAKPLTAAQYKLFSHWYYVAILELVRLATPRSKDTDWLQQMIHPAVPKRALEKAVSDLVLLGLLATDGGRGLSRKESMLTTEDEVKSLSVTNFHVQMSQMAIRAVLREPPADREFSTLTIATSAKGFQRVKEEIQKFRKRLHSLLEQEDAAPRSLVAHINLQLYPLSRRNEESREISPC